MNTDKKHDGASKSHEDNLKDHTEKSSPQKNEVKKGAKGDNKTAAHLEDPKRLQDDDHKMNKRLNDVEGEVTYDQEPTKKDNKKDDNDKGND